MLATKITNKNRFKLYNVEKNTFLKTIVIVEIMKTFNCEL